MLELDKLKIYTGIGSRHVTEDEKALQIALSKKLAKLGYTLKSGKAEGSDYNHALGAYQGSRNTNLRDKYQLALLPRIGFRPENTLEDELSCVPDIKFKPKVQQFYEDSGIMPWFGNQKQYIQEFHFRNFYQVMPLFTEPRSQFVIYCADEDEAGNVSGGTRTAVEVARYHNIRSFNIRRQDQLYRLWNFLDGLEAS